MAHPAQQIPGVFMYGYDANPELLGALFDRDPAEIRAYATEAVLYGIVPRAVPLSELPSDLNGVDVRATMGYRLHEVSDEDAVTRLIFCRSKLTRGIVYAMDKDERRLFDQWKMAGEVGLHKLVRAPVRLLGQASDDPYSQVPTYNLAFRVASHFRPWTRTIESPYPRPVSAWLLERAASLRNGTDYVKTGELPPRPPRKLRVV